MTLSWLYDLTLSDFAKDALWKLAILAGIAALLFLASMVWVLWLWWRAVRRHRQEHGDTRVSAALLRKAVHIETCTSDDIEEVSSIAQDCLALCEAGNLDGLRFRMHGWDRDRAERDGVRLVEIGATALLRPIHASIHAQDTPASRPVDTLDYDALEKLELLEAEYPTDHVLAACLAQAHTEMGFARRGSSWARHVTEQGWHGYKLHMARAAELIDAHDPVALDSAFVAAMAHKVAMDRADARTRIFTAFDTLLRVDPRNWDAYEAHGFRMLPRWYGDADTLEVQARRALARTEHEIGAAAYAAMYLTPLECEDAAFFSVDGALLSEGLRDMLTASGNPPLLVNSVLERLWDIAVENVDLAAAPDDPVTLQRQAITEAMDDVILENLTCHVTDVFTRRPRLLRKMVGALYKTEIEAGQIIRLRRGGRYISAVPAE